MLDHPTFGQEDKAALGIGQLDHNQIDAVFSGGLSGIIASIALVDKCNLHRLADHLLNLLAQLRHLGAFLLVGGCDQQRQQVAQRVYGQMDFAAPGCPGIVKKAKILSAKSRDKMDEEWDPRWFDG